MKSLAALLLAVFVVAGCGASLEKQIVGTWKIDTAKSVFEGEQMKDEASKKMAMSILQSVTLDLKDDKTFSMTLIFPIDGTWSLTGNKLLLTPTKKPGETVSFAGKETIDFMVEGDGKTMTSEITDKNMGGKLVMTKSEAAK